MDNYWPDPQRTVNSFDYISPMLVHSSICKGEGKDTSSILIWVLLHHFPILSRTRQKRQTHFISRLPTGNPLKNIYGQKMGNNTNFCVVVKSFLGAPPCSLVAELRGRSSTWPSRRHTRAPLAAAIRLMSGHGAQPRSNQGWFLWREEKTGEPGEKPSKHRREPTNSTHI